MKRYEREPLLKSFSLFFLLMALLYALGVYEDYRQRINQLDRQIFSEMKIFSFKPTGGAFGISFLPKQTAKDIGVLQRDEQGLYANFEIPGSK